MTQTVTVLCAECHKPITMTKSTYDHKWKKEFRHKKCYKKKANEWSSGK